MINGIDEELRAALDDAARRVPTDAVNRVSAADYRPRVKVTRTRLVWGGGGLAAAATASVAVLTLGTGVQSAFASWSPHPTASASGQVSAANDACQAQLATNPAFASLTGDGAWSVLTTDVRGPFTAFIYQDTATTATCVTGPTLTMAAAALGAGGAMSVDRSGPRVGENATSSSGSQLLTGQGAGGPVKVDMTHLDSSADGVYTLAEGRIGADVTGVTLTRSDGNVIDASTGGGWFIAWWPGDATVSSAAYTTSSGTTSVTLSAP